MNFISRTKNTGVTLNSKTVFTIAEAKNRLPKLIHNSEKEGIISISRHGKIVAYIICEKDFKKIIKSSNDFYSKLKEFREKNTLDNVSIWDNIRDKTPGREVQF